MTRRHGSEAVTEKRQPDLTQPSPEELVRTCLNCGARLEERKCKLYCPCGYYASCSDFL
jgi:hypothetical protein